MHPAILNQSHVDVGTGDRAETYLHMMQQGAISSSTSSRITYVFINMDNSVRIVSHQSNTMRARHKATATTMQSMTALIKVHISIFRAVDPCALVHSNSAAMSTFEEFTCTGECHRRRDGKLANSKSNATIYTR